ncbi:hypothetical protein GCM10009794_03270 [Rothia terrae]
MHRKVYGGSLRNEASVEQGFYHALRVIAVEVCDDDGVPCSYAADNCLANRTCTDKN